MIGGIHTGLAVAAIALLIDAVLAMADHLAPTTNATTARIQIHPSNPNPLYIQVATRLPCLWPSVDG